MINTIIVDELRSDLAVVEDERDRLQQELAALHAQIKEMQEKSMPLLQCVDCKNTESPAGAMARQFNHGRCVHCGGSFKVIRA